MVQMVYTNIRGVTKPPKNKEEMVQMKSWLAWLRKSGYEFTETVDEVNGCRTYDFGNGLVVIKWERKTGGLINNNGFTTSYGSNKLIQEELKEILG